tara:strand:- start:38 stop:328 length:291 start_codon:yes stop_codon:yes gene_type:complete
MGTIRYIVWNLGYIVIDRVKKVDFVHREKLLLSVVVSVFIFKAVGVEIVEPPEELGQLGIVEGLGNKPINRANPEFYSVHILCLRRGKGGRYQSSE